MLLEVTTANSPFTLPITNADTGNVVESDIYVVCSGASLIIYVPDGASINGFPNIYFISKNNATGITINVSASDYIATPGQPTSLVISGGSSVIFKKAGAKASEKTGFVVSAYSPGGSGGGGGTLFGKFQMAGGLLSYNIQAILGFPIASVNPVYYGPSVMDPTAWGFDVHTQLLTLSYEQDGLWIQFGYTLPA